VDDRCCVVDVRVGVHEANDSGNAAQLAHNAVEGALVVADEGTPQQQVFRRIAGEGQFREGNDVGAEVAGARSVVKDLGSVAIEVADYGVDLRERDS
jgi:hypothetical protein